MSGEIDEVERRLAFRIERLAEITEPGRGVTRPGFSALEREAHAQLAEWGIADGAEVSCDPAGNTVLTFRGGVPYFLLGSHLDSVPQGGKFDGVAGVLTAVEAARSARDDVRLGLRVVAFTAEEGATFGRPCLGSELATGELPIAELDALRDGHGVSAAERATQAGLRPSECPPWIAPDAVAAFLELHIEQGAILESERVRIGVVDAIAGTSRLELRCHGRAGHSGTTPMRLRADALTAAAEIALAVEEAARSSHGVVATIGRLTVSPNGVTTIPSDVEAVVDIRGLDPSDQERLVEAISRTAAAVGARRGVEVTVRPVSWRHPVMLGAWPKRALKQACSDLTMPFRVLASGAGHDSAVVAARVPVGMVFVPTPGGFSHVPEEACRIEDLRIGSAILAKATRHLDRDVTAASTRP